MYIDSQSIGGLSKMVLITALAKALEKTPHDEDKEVVIDEIELGDDATYSGEATQFRLNDLDGAEETPERCVRLISLDGGWSSGEDHGEYETFAVEFGTVVNAAGKFDLKSTFEFTEGSSSNDSEIAAKLRPLSEQKLGLLGDAVTNWLLNGTVPSANIDAELKEIQSNFPA